MNDLEQLSEIRAIIEATAQSKTAIQNVMDYLAAHRDDYHWVGIYWLDGLTLRLGPFHGPETDHTEIPVGRGVCGTAVKDDKNQVIADVSKLDNYLACNLHTKSEIVVLIRDPKTKEILGQIDVDGRRLNQFSKEDEGFLDQVGKLLAPYVAHLRTGV